VSEARAGGEDYGLARLRKQVEDHAGASAAQLGERILADVSGFMGTAPRGDDLTLLIVKVR
jgi:serine phosphatase RsbU (regulator of sigma subunit)